MAVRWQRAAGAARCTVAEVATYWWRGHGAPAGSAYDALVAGARGYLAGDEGWDALRRASS